MYLQDRRKLAKLMVIQGISQREMARSIGWKSHSYLARLIRGEATTVSTESAVLMAHTLGVPVDDLFLTRTDTSPVRSGHLRRTA